MWFYLICAGLLFYLFFYIKNPRNLKKVIPYISKIWNTILPDDWQESLDSLEYNKIRALNQIGSISKMILLQAYHRLSENFGYFYLVTGRIGIGLELNPPSILTEKSIKEIQGVLDSIEIKDVAIQIITYASSDIKYYTDGIANVCTCDSRVGNIENLELMKEERIRKTNQWAKKSMLSEESGADLRARNFINMILFIFPQGTNIRKIKSFTNTVRGVLESFSPRLISPTIISKIYGEILREDSSLEDYDIHKKMNVQLAKNAHVRIERDLGLIKIGKKTYAKVLTTDKYPVTTDSFEVGNAFFAVEGEYQISIATPFLASLTIHIDNPVKTKKKILDKARWNIKQASKIQGQEVVKFPSIGDTIEESRNIINYVEKEDQVIYDAMYSITVFDTNEENLEQSIGRLKTKFKSIRTGGWNIAEEKFGLIAYQSLLWSMPFQFDIETKEHLKRFDLMFNSNITSIVPLISSFKGIGSPVLRFFARTGQVVGLDFWAGKENYNVCVIGPSGSGKSFLSNSIQASHLQAGVKVTIFDKGRSYLPLCQELGGQFIDFAKLDENGKENIRCLNFFTNIETVLRDPESFDSGDTINLNYVSYRMSDLIRDDGKIESIEEDCFQALVLIIGIMAGQDYSSGIKVDAGHEDNSSKSMMQTLIEEALMSAFYKKGRNAGMREVSEALTEFQNEAGKRGHKEAEVELRSLVTALSPFCNPGGKFYNYFNGTCNINLDSDFTLLELDDLSNKGSLYNLVMMSMLERCASDMYFDRTKKKSIVVDEAADALADPVYAKYFADFCRRVRKYGGSMMTITQGVRDYMANTYSEAVWTNSSHKMLLRLNPNEIAKGFEAGGLFSGYSELTKMQMGSVSNRAPEYSEFLYIGDGGFSDVFILKATPQEASMFTTNPMEQQQKKELQHAYGLTPQQSTSLLGYLKEGIDIQEALKLVKEKNKSGTTEFWVNKIRYAVHNDGILPYAQKVCDENDDIVYYETFLRLRDEKEIYSPRDFLETAINQELLGMISKNHLEKCIEFFVPKRQKFSMNFDISQINSHLIDSINDSFKNKEDREFFVFEVEAKNINEKEVFDFCVKAKENGYAIALDNIDFKIKLTDLETLRPDFMKISGELISGAYSNEDDRKKVYIFSQLGRAFNVLSIANHIENQKLLLMAKDIGVNYFQGYFIQEPIDIQTLFEEEKEKENVL